MSGPALSASWRTGWLRRVYSVSVGLGLDVNRMVRGLPGVTRVIGDAAKYRKLQDDRTRFPLRWRLIHPCCGDSGASAGHLDRHYFRQDLWAGRRIFAARPAEHVDIGSRLDGFIGHLLCFMPVTVVDIRKMDNAVPGLTMIQEDATSLKRFADCSVASLSSLHAVEHFGLGRYGDPVNPEACFDVMRSFQRVLKTGGRLYLSVPVGVERLEFNAHRVFSPATVIATMSGLRLVSFSLIDDAGRFHEEGGLDDAARQWYGCGMFEFTKDRS